MADSGELTEPERRRILGFARAVISAGCAGGGEPEVPDIPRLAELGSCFVTLREAGEVRGCIGSLESFEPLAENLRRNAENAAFSDPAFPPLEADELNFVTLEVSIPAPALRIGSPDELTPGRDGAILVFRGRRSVFLPHTIAERRWSAAETWDNLARKAGAEPGVWRSPEAELYIFRCETFSE